MEAAKTKLRELRGEREKGLRTRRRERGSPADFYKRGVESLSGATTRCHLPSRAPRALESTSSGSHGGRQLLRSGLGTDFAPLIGASRKEVG